MTERDIEKMRQTVARLEKQYNQLQGGYKQALESIGCDSIDEAEATLERLLRKQSAIEEQLSEAIDEFQRKYPQLLP